MNDVLYEMACLYSNWKDITYKIVLGRKQKTYELMLHFPAASFFHIAGEYSNAIVHAFQKFKAPFSGKIVHIFPEQSAVI